MFSLLCGVQIGGTLFHLHCDNNSAVACSAVIVSYILTTLHQLWVYPAPTRAKLGNFIQGGLTVVIFNKLVAAIYRAHEPAMFWTTGQQMEKHEGHSGCSWSAPQNLKWAGENIK